MPSPPTRETFGTSAVSAMLCPFSQRRQHLAERRHAALAVKLAAVIAGAANALDAEPLQRDGIDLAVAVARDQHLGAVLRLSHERHHEMLAVPHREDDRQVGLEPLIDVRRLEDRACW